MLLSSTNREITSGLNPTDGEVKLLYLFNVLLCGKFKNPKVLFDNCRYAAGDEWYILKHHLTIKGCHRIPLKSFLDANSFCWFHNRDWGVLSSNFNSWFSITFFVNSCWSSDTLTPFSPTILFIKIDCCRTFLIDSRLTFWVLLYLSSSSSLVRCFTFTGEESETRLPWIDGCS